MHLVAVNKRGLCLLWSSCGQGGPPSHKEHESHNHADDDKGDIWQIPALSSPYKDANLNTLQCRHSGICFIIGKSHSQVVMH